MHTSPFSAAALFAKPLASRLTGCCAALLWLSSFAVPNARAQNTASLTAIGTFNGATGAQPTQALTIGPDGNLFYGTAPRGGANDNNVTDDGGTFFSVTRDGTITLLRSLSSISSGSPNSKLLLASNGNFYGTTAPIESGSDAVATVSQFTTGGGLTIEHAFANGTTDGAGPVGGLIQGLDGALYGVTQAGGDATPSYTSGDGTVFKLALNGTFTQLHRFSFHQNGIEGYAPNSALVQGRDGYFYGVTAAGGNNGVGVVYRMTSDGTLTDGSGRPAGYLYSFTGSAGDGGSPVGPLVEGDPGVFYGITTSGGAAGLGTFFSITSGGALTTLHSFTSTELNSQSPSGLIKAQDGNFYVTTGSGSTDVTGGAVVQLTPAGNASQVIESTTGGINALVQANDGNFYGTTIEGGVSNVGTVFRLVIQPPPAFFDGEVALSNSVYYLSFPDGNYFGYYSFLTDAHYIYHFDLGYEYVFDAADGRSGVYLYDFASSVFFYTNPSVFPYLYDFTLKTELYYYPNPNSPGRYNTNGTRYFFKFNADGKTGQVITNPATGT